MIEEWRNIDGVENYAISNHGNVKNLKTNNVLKQYIHPTGYYVLNIKPDGRLGKSKTLKIHREIAKAFIPNPDNHPQINHIDGNKLNNSINNLEWCTGSHNMKHAYATGLANVQGERGPAHRLTEVQVNEILNNPQIRNIDFARKFNIDRSAISKIRHKKRWTHL